jgi:uncharacterized membrane protein YoaK (UPF0700 family)
MQDQSRANRLFAVALSVLAGFVDGVGFLELGGFFVSFMSGNATRLGVNASELAPGALVAIALALSFMLGVMLGTLVGESAGRTRPAWVLGLVGSLLASAAWLGHLGQSALASAMMALAMGAENATLVSKDGSLFGVTYVTGALVKAGQRLAQGLRGGDAFGWSTYLLLWSGLAAGAGAGALAFSVLGLRSLWVAAAAAFVLAAAARLLPAPVKAG